MIAQTLRVRCYRLKTSALLLLSPTGLVLGATKDVIPAHDLGCLAPSQETGSLDPSAANPVLDHDLASPSLARSLANLAPDRPTGSLVQRAAPRGDLMGILAADQRKSLLIKSLAAVRLPLLRMEKRNFQRNRPTVCHPHRKMIADPTQEKNAQPPAQSPAHGPDQPLRISGSGQGCFS